MKTVLSARQPFSLPTVVRSHGWIQLAPFTEIGTAEGFSYAMELDPPQDGDAHEAGRVVEVQVGEAPGGVSVSVDLLPGILLGPAEEAQICRAIEWMLGLDLDFSAFYALASGEPKLQGAASRARGRILRSATLFEDVVKTILTTNTLWAATIRMNKNLVAQFGSPAASTLSPGAEKLPDPQSPPRKAFPSPRRLAQVSEETLRLETRLGYRAPFVAGVARQVAAGELDLEALKTSSLPTAELRKELLRIRGIGPYAAANLLMLLGRYDFIPVDSWAVKMVSQEWHNGQPVVPAQVEAAFERWGEWRGLAYWCWEWTTR
jgi:3-methyladenine DNA glycosylase/8-oxoguanine DNA glycosylase